MMNRGDVRKYIPVDAPSLPPAAGHEEVRSHGDLGRSLLSSLAKVPAMVNAMMDSNRMTLVQNRILSEELKRARSESAQLRDELRVAIEQLRQVESKLETMLSHKKCKFGAEDQREVLFTKE